jgi:arylsulfatase A-like enzyme
VLARQDAFGHDFVGKFHWYIFHALCFDAKWLAIGALPFLAHSLFWERRAPRWATMALWSLVAIHCALLMATVADHELQRFLGSHLTPSVFETYGNASSLREIPNFFANDKSVPFLPLVLFLGVPFLAVGLWKLLERRGWIVSRARAWFVGFGLFAVAGWIYTDLAWPGGNRARKLAPVVQVWWEASRSANAAALPDSTYFAASRRWSRSWMAEAGSDTLWRFPDSSRPFWKVPAGDTGVTDSVKHNVVLVVIETGRALEMGALGDHGATADATPFLDSVARTGWLWTRHACPSMPTVRALTSIHLGIWDHPDRNIVSSFPGLGNRSLPNILRDHGWEARFFSAADPAWDNESPWLGRWYDGYDYSSSRERDGDMFAHASRWIRDSLGSGKPFFVTLMTKSNHYPFDQFRAWTREPDLRKRLLLSYRYTDSCIGAFVGSLRGQPWFARTTFVVTGDHGFPLGEHGPGNMGHGLFAESVWLPLVAWGGSPALAVPRIVSIPSSHLDLGPTILHLAGVRAANHFAGHDLLDPSRSDSALVVLSHYDEIAGTRGAWRSHGALADGLTRDKGPQLFRLDVDPREESDSARGRGALQAGLVSEARDRIRLLVEALRRNALVP